MRFYWLRGSRLDITELAYPPAGKAWAKWGEVRPGSGERPALEIHNLNVAGGKLTPARDLELISLVRAALEWQAVAPFTIRSRADLKSAVHWQDRVEPYEHQIRNLMAFCQMAPAALFADDVGLGKTISAGLVLSELMTRERVRRALVICPRLLAAQWATELESKFQINSFVIEKSSQVDEALESPAAVVISTYQIAAKWLSGIRAPRNRFEMVILDEAHRMRNLYGSPGRPVTPRQIRSALASGLFLYTLLLTATPIQNRLSDMYTLIDLLTVAQGHQNPLGEFREFNRRFPVAHSGGRQLHPDLAGEFREILNRYVTRVRRSDVSLPFPSRQVEQLPVRLTAGELALQRCLSIAFRSLNTLQRINLGEALMSSPPAVVTQLAGMARSNEELRPVAAEAYQIALSIETPAKLTRLVTLCNELRQRRADWRLLVFTRRIETMDMVFERLQQIGVPAARVRGGAAKTNAVALEQFRHDPPKIHVLVSTDTGAEGINLQQANWIVNYDLPWNPMVLEQRIGRIQRLGSRHKEVFVQNLVAEGTVEELVVARLVEKLAMISEVVGDVESILSNLATNSDEDQTVRLADRIRDLVIQSLEGVDVQIAAAECEKSILRAKEVYVEQRRMMDHELGRIDPGSTAGDSDFQIDLEQPQIPANKLVQLILARDGEFLTDRPDGLAVWQRAKASSVLVALDQAAANEATARGLTVERLYPGERDFERLLSEFVHKQRPQHEITVGTPVTEAELGQTAATWIARYPAAKLLKVEKSHEVPRFGGRALLNILAANRLDKLALVREIPVGEELPDCSDELPSARFEEDFRFSELTTEERAAVCQRIIAEPTVQKFVRHYAQRLERDRQRAGANQQMLSRVERDLSVSTSAEMLGLVGQRWVEVAAEATVEVDGVAYPIPFRVDSRQGVTLHAPPEQSCPISGWCLPEGILQRCALTLQLVPRHQLAISQISGRQVLTKFTARCAVSNALAVTDELEQCEFSEQWGEPRFLVTCCVTGQRLLRTVAWRSDVSGRWARPDQCSRSELPPGRIGLYEEFRVCSATGRRLLQDEGQYSELSGDWGGTDQLHVSPRTGRTGLLTESEICAESGARLLTDELGLCELTGGHVNTELLVRSDASGRAGLARLSARCAESDLVGLDDELETCTYTGMRVLSDLLGTCAISGARILSSRLQQCALTGVLMSPAVAVCSDVSGRMGAPSTAIRSARPPHRTGLSDEVSRCEVSGRQLLIDETSVISGRTIDNDLLVVSPVSGKSGWPADMVRCELTQAMVFADEAGRCAITGQRVRVDRLVTSQVSGRTILETHSVRSPVSGRIAASDELLPCSVSGRMALKDELETCHLTGKRVFPGVLGHCAETGHRVLPELLGQSAVSKKMVLRSRLSPSSVPPGRLGTQSELARCKFTNATLLVDELMKSDISGELFDARDAVRCARTRQIAHRSELVRCEETDNWLAPSEVGVCHYTGRRVQKNRLKVSPSSGTRALASLFRPCVDIKTPLPEPETVVCAITGERYTTGGIETCAATGVRAARRVLTWIPGLQKWVVPDEAGESDYSRRTVLRSQLLTSDEPPNRRGLASEMGRCGITGRQLLLDELEPSAIGGVLVTKRLLEASARSGRRAHRSQMVKCAESGAWLLPDETAQCEFTGRVVDRTLLVRSPVTGRMALNSLFVLCEVDNVSVPAPETLVCEHSGQRVLASATVTCRVTGKRVHASHVVAVSSVGGPCLKTELIQTDYNPRWILKSHGAKSDKPPHRIGSREDLVRCAKSKKLLMRDEVVAVGSTQQPVDVDLTTICAASGNAILRAKAKRCAWLDQLIHERYLRECELTHLPVSKTQLDAKGMLKPLTRLLDGVHTESDLSEEEIQAILAQVDRKLFASCYSSIATLNPSGTQLAIVALLRGRNIPLLGRSEPIVGLVVERAEGAIRTKSPILIGKRWVTGWSETERREMD